MNFSFECIKLTGTDFQIEGYKTHFAHYGVGESYPGKPKLLLSMYASKYKTKKKLHVFLLSSHQPDFFALTLTFF